MIGAVGLATNAATTSGPAWWITILVAAIAACASILAAIVAAIAARSTKRLEMESEHTRELENRISERKFDMYKPMIELLGDLTSGNRSADVLAKSDENLEKMTDFATWINVYGSDDAVIAYHNFMQAAYNNAPALFMSRLYAEFLLAVRRDISYPHTRATAAHVLGIKISDMYSVPEYRLAVTLPFDELCEQEKWTPPWLAEANARPIGKSGE